MDNKYSYDDANPTYRIINRTFYIFIGKINKVISIEEDYSFFNDKLVLSTVIKLKAKCVMYSHIKLLGVLRPIDKRVYLN